MGYAKVLPSHSSCLCPSNVMQNDEWVIHNVPPFSSQSCSQIVSQKRAIDFPLTLLGGGVAVCFGITPSQSQLRVTEAFTSVGSYRSVDFGDDL